MTKGLSSKIWVALTVMIVAAGAAFGYSSIGKTSATDGATGSAISEVGTVVQIIDGTSFRVEVGDREMSVRLYQVASPAANSPYARASLEALHDMILARVVALTFRGQDAEGMWLADVSLDGKNVAAEQLARGFAAISKNDGPVPVSLTQQEGAARAEARGIWSRS